MPMRNLQPGIGDNNDLLVRLRTNTKDADTSSVIYPEIAEGTYYSYTDESTEIQEFPVFAEPSELTVFDDYKQDDGTISIELDHQPDTKQAPYVILKTADEIKRFTLVPELIIIDELPVSTFYINKPVMSKAGNVLSFNKTTFPYNIVVGSKCFNTETSNMQYTVVSIDTDNYTITLDRDAV